MVCVTEAMAKRHTPQDRARRKARLQHVEPPSVPLFRPHHATQSTHSKLSRVVTSSTSSRQASINGVVPGAVVLAIESLQARPIPRAHVDDFEIIEAIGRSRFGTCFKVRKRDIGKTFFMKTQRKRLLSEAKQLNRTERMHALLSYLNHACVTTLCYLWETVDKIYSVTEVAQGGDLFAVLKQERRLPIAAARMQVAEVVCALDYLHSCGVMYRDLKTENISLDKFGHIQLRPSRLMCMRERSRELCGTPEYLAPEILSAGGVGGGGEEGVVGEVIERRGEDEQVLWKEEDEVVEEEERADIATAGRLSRQEPNGHSLTEAKINDAEVPAPDSVCYYTKQADWWAVGILLYELLLGFPPFYSQNVNQTYAKIASAPLRFPTHMERGKAQALISGLLERDPNKRMGVREIQSHSFFSGLDWDKVGRREVNPPFKPDTRENPDITCWFPTYVSNSPVDSD